MSGQSLSLKRALRSVFAIFALLALVGCGPSQQEKQKWESFNSHFGIADSRYRFSFGQMKKVFAEAAQGDGDAMLIAAVRGANLSVWIKSANEGSKEVAEASQDFDYLYSNSKEVPASMKSDFFRFKEIVDGNAMFIENCQAGRISLDTLKKWVTDMEKYEAAYQSIHLETKKVFTKHNWFFVDIRI